MSTQSPQWLQDMKRRLQKTDAVVKLRRRAVNELRVRLKRMERLHPHGLATLPQSEREDLFRSVAEAVTREGEGVLWTGVRHEAQRLLDEHLAVAVALVSPRDIDRKIHVALQETEAALVSILSKWPDSRIALRGCINSTLPKHLRITAWRACLSDSATVADFFDYFNSDRIDKNSILLGPSLFNFCQSFLASYPLLHALGSQFHTVKRMEQVLAYLLDPSSIKHLRILKIDIFPFSTYIPHPNTPNKPHPDLVGLNSQLRKRQMMFLAPFLKAMDLDDSIKTVSASPRNLPEDVIELTQVAASAEDHLKSWHPKTLKLHKNRGTEEENTARVAEVYAKFWSIIPVHWRVDGDEIVTSIAGQVESYLQKEDYEFHKHILYVIDKDSNARDFFKFSSFVNAVVGDIFVAKCSLDVVCYIFDQLIMASYESTNDPNFPSMDTLCSWICSSIILLLRDKIMKCKTPQDLYSIVDSCVCLLSTSLISSTMEVHFLSRFRRTLKNGLGEPPFVDLPNQIFGYDTNADMSLSHEMKEKIGLYLRKLKGKDTDDLIKMTERDLVESESEELALMTEFYIEKRKKDRRRRELMKKWKTYSFALGIWRLFLQDPYERAKLAAIEREKNDLARLERERLLALELENAKKNIRVPSPEEEPMTDMSFFSLLVDPIENDDNIFGITREDSESEDLDNLNALADIETHDDLEMDAELLRQAELEAEAERRRILELNSMVPYSRPPFVRNTILVQKGSYVGEEKYKLTHLGQIISQIFQKTQYRFYHLTLVLFGDLEIMSAQNLKRVSHAFNFQYQLDRDLAAALKELRIPFKEVKTFRESMKNVPQSKLPKVISIMEKHRATKYEQAARNSSKVDDDDFLRIQEGSEKSREAGMNAAFVLLKKRKLEKNLKGFAHLFVTAIEDLKLVINGDSVFREANWTASCLSEAVFYSNEELAWKAAFSDKEYTRENVKQLFIGYGGKKGDEKQERFLKEMDRVVTERIKSDFALSAVATN